MIEPEDLRAFYSDGSTGICMHLKVWHTMPVCLRGEEVYLTARGKPELSRPLGRCPLRPRPRLGPAARHEQRSQLAGVANGQGGA